MLSRPSLIFTTLLCFANNVSAESIKDPRSFIDPVCEGIKSCQDQASKGDKYAQFALAEIHAFGKLDVPKDEEKALFWFQKSSQSGYAPASYAIGQIYAFGRGVIKDEIKSIEYYKLAADQGHADSQSLLGDLYLEGYKKIIKQDEHLAIKYYEMAARQGHFDSQYYLSLLYFNSKDYKDNIKSYAWAKIYLEYLKEPELLEIFSKLEKQLPSSEKQKADLFIKSIRE